MADSPYYCDMREYLEQQIIARRQRLAALEQERSTVAAELRAYEDALTRTAGGSTEVVVSEIASLSRRSERINISRVWTAILRPLAGYKHFNANEIMRIANGLFKAEQLPRTQTFGGIRSQLSLYAKKGIIVRLGGGNYRVSEQFKAELQVHTSRKTLHLERRSLSQRSPMKEFGPELPAPAQRTAGDAR